MSVNPEHRKKIAQVVAQAWSDEGYKKKLLQNPKAVLKKAGVALPAKMAVHVHEDQPDALHVVIPSKPQPLSTDEFSHAAQNAPYTAGPAYTVAPTPYTAGPAYTIAAQPYTAGPAYTVAAQPYTAGPAYTVAAQPYTEGPAYTVAAQPYTVGPAYTTAQGAAKKAAKKATRKAPGKP